MKSNFRFSVFIFALLAFTSSTFALSWEDSVFKDVVRSNTTIYESEAINSLHERSIVEGYENDNYKPQNPISRAEFLKITMEATDMSLGGSNCFNDVSDEWFAPYVCAAAAANIIDGYADGSFKPDQKVNFAEASKMIANAFELSTRSGAGENWFTKYVVALEENGAIPDSIPSFNKEVSRGEMAFAVYALLLKKENPYFYWDSWGNVSTEKHDQLTFADIQALQNSNLNLEYVYGLEPTNFYTDGNKIYKVFYAKVYEIKGANLDSFRYWDESSGSHYIFRGNDKAIFINTWDEMEYFSLDLDFDTLEILGYNNDDRWTILRDKKGLYATSVQLSKLHDITGQVEDVEGFEFVECEKGICGKDANHSYFSPYPHISLAIEE